MYPVYSYAPEFPLSVDDIKGIQELYGKYGRMQIDKRTTVTIYNMHSFWFWLHVSAVVSIFMFLADSQGPTQITGKSNPNPKLQRNATLS